MTSEVPYTVSLIVISLPHHMVDRCLLTSTTLGTMDGATKASSGLNAMAWLQNELRNWIVSVPFRGYSACLRGNDR